MPRRVLIPELQTLRRQLAWKRDSHALCFGWIADDDDEIYGKFMGFCTKTYGVRALRITPDSLNTIVTRLKQYDDNERKHHRAVVKMAKYPSVVSLEVYIVGHFPYKSETDTLTYQTELSLIETNCAKNNITLHDFRIVRDEPPPEHVVAPFKAAVAEL